MTPLEYLIATIIVTGMAIGYGWLLVTVFTRGVDGHEWWRRP